MLYSTILIKLGLRFPVLHVKIILLLKEIIHSHMSNENMGLNQQIPQPSNEDLEAAEDLIAGNELLSSNPRVKKLQENLFVTEDGRQLDAGNFLAAMVAFLEKQGASATQDDLNQALDLM